MTYFTTLFASLLLVIGFTTSVNAASVFSQEQSYKVYQTETSADETKKKAEGEEEEPDC